MPRKFYKIATETIDEIYWTLLLSCIIKEQSIRARWQIYLKIEEINQVDIYVWIVNLFPSKKIEDELYYIKYLIGELKGEVDYKCKKYQNWKSILDSEGSAFLEERKGCIATWCGTFDKLKPAQRFFTVPAGIFDSVFAHQIDFFRRLGDNSDRDLIEVHIIPLVNLINSLHSTSTISSCQGHYLWPSNRYPFVCFICKIEMLKNIYKALYSTELKTRWTLAGIVENGCPSLGPCIVWKLMARDKLTIFNKNKYRQDIARLSSLLKSSALSKDTISTRAFV